MKKPKLYVDTSVLGAFFDTEDQKRVDTAQSLIKLKTKVVKVLFLI